MFKTNQPLPRVMVLATGGTIAGVQHQGSGYRSGQLTAEALLSVLPDVSEIASVAAEQIANVGSQSISYDIWLSLLARISGIVQNDEADAVVITHGTDTMEETAYFLQLALLANIPVVLTGAMRPANAWGADGPQNLFDAICVAAASAPGNNGVQVVMNGLVHNARYVQKTSCEGLDAFVSREAGPVARIDARQVVLYGTLPAGRTPAGSGSSLAPAPHMPAPRVIVWYVMAEDDEISLKALLATHPQGIIVAGVGNGNMSDMALRQLQQARQQGIVVVRSSRCASGAVTRNLEVNDDTSGFIVANDLNPQKARVLLMLALQKTNNPARIQEFFNKY
ncbi:MAG: asparaginase [Pusillimonas sp.]